MREGFIREGGGANGMNWLRSRISRTDTDKPNAGLGLRAMPAGDRRSVVVLIRGNRCHPWRVSWYSRVSHTCVGADVLTRSAGLRKRGNFRGVFLGFCNEPAAVVGGGENLKQRR